MVGSDQVWNPRVIDDSAFLLDFLDNNSTVKISYAASIGDALSKEEKSYLLDHLAQFKHVSFRESIQLDDFVKNLSSVSVNVDPVFLTSSAEWLELAAKGGVEVPNEDYIVVYEVNSPPGFARYLHTLRQVTDKKIVVIATRPIPKYLGVQTYSSCSPYDFLRLVSKSSFVLTSSFHGVAFSCLLNKDFITVLSAKKSGRQKELLHNLGLSSRIIQEEDAVGQAFSTPINWGAVNQKIGELSQESRTLLREVLGEDPQKNIS